MIYLRWVLLVLVPTLAIMLALDVLIMYMLRNRPWQ